MNRREATRKIGALLGGSFLAAPYDLLQPEAWEHYTQTLKETSDEDLIPFVKLTEASWHLLRASELAVLERVLGSYLPKVEVIAQVQSPQQHLAATLTSQNYLLIGILASHRLNLDARRQFHQKALYYSKIAQDSAIQVAASIQLASAFQYLHQPKKVKETYEGALPLLDRSTPLLGSCMYLGLADATAQCGQTQEALRYIGMARELFPYHPENDPAFLYADAGFFSQALYEGLTFLTIEQPEKAWDALKKIDNHPETPERVRLEIINLQAEAAIALDDVERLYDCAVLGRNGAVKLGSAKRYQEIYTTYRHARQTWGRHARLKELAELFVQ